jgi:uncharacterized small protein (DUF1192 family)
LDIYQIPRFNHDKRADLGAARPCGQAVDGAKRSGPDGRRAVGEVAMNFDEEPIRVVKRALDDMSIQELKERIEALRSDIVACEQMIQKKEATRKAAEAAFFKS